MVPKAVKSGFDVMISEKSEVLISPVADKKLNLGNIRVWKSGMLDISLLNTALIKLSRVML